MIQIGVTEFKKALNRTEREVLLDEEIAEQKPLKYQKKWRKILRVGRFVFRFSIFSIRK